MAFKIITIKYIYNKSYIVLFNKWYIIWIRLCFIKFLFIKILEKNLNQ
jgi:hypothetical protein